jgi:hypothetical protein
VGFETTDQVAPESVDFRKASGKPAGLSNLPNAYTVDGVCGSTTMENISGCPGSDGSFDVTISCFQVTPLSVLLKGPVLVAA